MTASERILIEILAQIKLRIIAKQQSGIRKSDSVNQEEPDDKDREPDKTITNADSKSLLVEEKNDTSG